MGNLSVALTVPALNGTGAGSSIAAFGKEKTIIVDDSAFDGAVQIEGMSGGGWVPLCVFTAPGRKVIEMALSQIRVVRVNAASGTPGVTVLANDDGAQFVELPAAGTSIDTSDLGTFNTVLVDAGFGGMVQIQISEDETNWVDIMAFQAPGHQSQEFTANFMRANLVNGTGTPVIWVGAVNDDTAHKPQQALVSGANVAWDAGVGTKAHLVLGENLTLDNPTNCEPGMILDLVVEQDGTGGRTVAYGSAWEWPAGTNPVITVAAAAMDTIRGVVHAVDANGVATQILATFAQAYAV